MAVSPAAEGARMNTNELNPPLAEALLRPLRPSDRESFCAIRLEGTRGQGSVTRTLRANIWYLACSEPAMVI